MPNPQTLQRFIARVEENAHAEAIEVYIISLRLATAKKPETRQRRLEKVLAMLEKGEFR